MRHPYLPDFPRQRQLNLPRLATGTYWPIRIATCGHRFGACIELALICGLYFLDEVERGLDRKNDV
jgi:hypothetical protein